TTRYYDLSVDQREEAKMTSSPGCREDVWGDAASDLDVLLCLGNEEELTAGQLAALARLDDGPLDPDSDEDLYGTGFGSDNCPPDGWDLMTPTEQRALLDGAPPITAVPEVLDAGFTHRDGGDGRGFAAGGVLDQMAPGGRLAMVTDRVWAK